MPVKYKNNENVLKSFVVPQKDGILRRYTAEPNAVIEIAEEDVSRAELAGFIRLDKPKEAPKVVKAPVPPIKPKKTKKRRRF